MKPVQWEIRTRGRPLWKRILASVGAPLLIHSATQFCPFSPDNHGWARGHHISPQKHQRLITCYFSDNGIIEEGLKLVFWEEEKKKNPTGRKSGHPTIPPRYRLIKHKREVLQERALSNEKPAPCQNAPRTYWALLKHNRRQGQANNVQCEHSTVLAGAQSITI